MLLHYQMDDATFPDEGVTVSKITGPYLFLPHRFTIISYMKLLTIDKICDLRNRKSPILCNKAIHHCLLKPHLLCHDFLLFIVLRVFFLLNFITSFFIIYEFIITATEDSAKVIKIFYMAFQLSV